MQNLIDYTYFQGTELAIPNINTSLVKDSIIALIARVQRRILMDALGSDLYYELESNYVPLSGDKWADIVEGKNYEQQIGDELHTIRWNGLKNTEKESLIAYFVYAEWMRLNSSQTTSFGEMKGTAENAQIFSGREKMVSAYNNGVHLYGNTGGQEAEKRYYQDVIIRSREGLEVPSLYNFIAWSNEQDSATYPKWIFTEKSFMNNFEI